MNLHFAPPGSNHLYGSLIARYFTMFMSIVVFKLVFSVVMVVYGDVSGREYIAGLFKNNG